MVLSCLQLDPIPPCSCCLPAPERVIIEKCIGGLLPWIVSLILISMDSTTSLLLA